MTGFFCPQSKEDHYRLLIDEALKSIDPPIFTDAYIVSFKPIMEDTGRLSGDSLSFSIGLLSRTLHPVSAKLHKYVFKYGVNM